MIHVEINYKIAIKLQGKLFVIHKYLYFNILIFCLEIVKKILKKDLLKTKLSDEQYLKIKEFKAQIPGFN